MIVKNKKNGTNVLAFREGVQNVRVIIAAHEVVDIPALTEFEQVINKSDFENRGWFEIVIEEAKKEVVVEKKEKITEEKKETTISEEETNLEKAKKEVKEYASSKKIKNN